MKNYFRLFDYMLEHVDEKLTRDMIIETSNQEDVEEDIDKLLKKYNFHYYFEKIHPFGEENGLGYYLKYYEKILNLCKIRNCTVNN